MSNETVDPRLEALEEQLDTLKSSVAILATSLDTTRRILAKILAAGELGARQARSPSPAGTPPVAGAEPEKTGTPPGGNV